MKILELLSLLPNLPVLIWPLLPVSRKPRWLAYLPAAALALSLLQILFEGYRFPMILVYGFNGLFFLFTLRHLLHPDTTQPRRRFLAVLGGLVGMLFLALAAALPVLIPARFVMPPVTGPYAVGTATYAWTDPTRMETFTPVPDDHRSIVVQVWYPVDPTGDPRAESEMPNAPISNSQASYPVVIFSHGAMGLRASNASTMHELASHGFIAASIDHTYQAIVTIYPDGQHVFTSPDFFNTLMSNQSGAQSPEEALQATREWNDLRTADIRFTIDQLDHGAASTLDGKADLNRLGLMGHSMGAAGAASVCRLESRCKGVIALDGTLSGERIGLNHEMTQEIFISDPYPQPILEMNSSHFGDPNYNYNANVYVFEHTLQPAYLVKVNGSEHLNFSDLPARIPLLSRLLSSSINNMGGFAGSIDPVRCMTIVNEYTLAFFDQYLYQQPATLLNTPDAFSEVEVQTHNVSAAAR